MFASQLLRILQTLPEDSKYDPRAFDTAELKERMKGNQNGVHRHSNGYHNRPDSLSYKSKDSPHSNGCAMDVDPLALQTREGSNFWDTPELKSSAVIDDFTKDTECEIKVSQKEDHGGLFYTSTGGKKFSDSLTSDRKDINKLWNTPELECSVHAEKDFANSNKHESHDSVAPLTSPDMFRSDSQLCTDKTVMEYELPELMVCYKEINYHVVKDICIDKGVPDEGNGLIDLHTDDLAGPCVSEPSNECGQNETSGDLNFTLLIPDGSRASSEEDIDDYEGDKCKTNEEEDIVSFVPVKLDFSPKVGIGKDLRTPEHLTEACETKRTPNKTENDVSTEESIVTSMLPLKGFGTRSFLRSFMDSLNDDGDEDEKSPKQCSPIETDLESLTAGSKVEKSNTDGPPNKLVYDSEVENGSISFDFNSLDPAAANSWDMSAQTIEKSRKSENALNHNDGNTDNRLAANLVGHVGLGTNNVHQQSSLKNRNSINPFTVDEVQSFIMDGTENIRQETVLNHKKGKSNNPFANCEVQIAVMTGSNENIDEIPVLNHKKGNFNPFTFSDVTDNNAEVIHQSAVLNAKNGNSKNPFAVGEVQTVSMSKTSESNHELPVLNDKKIGKATNPFSATEVQSSLMAESTGGMTRLHGQNLKNGNSNNPFTIEEVQCDRIGFLKLDEMPDHSEDGTTKNLSTVNQVHCLTSIAGNSENVQERSVEPQDLPGENTTSMSFTDGEASFSAAGQPSGLITYSGPITHSASTSLRSDSSTTSGRSFAFPVLQSEWSSSPVRMGKADKPPFRKPKGWKQGAWRALCCSGRSVG